MSVYTTTSAVPETHGFFGGCQSELGESEKVEAVALFLGPTSKCVSTVGTKFIQTSY